VEKAKERPLTRPPEVEGAVMALLTPFRAAILQQQKGMLIVNIVTGPSSRKEGYIQSVETGSAVAIGSSIGKVIEQLVGVDGEGVRGGSIVGALLAGDVVQAEGGAERDQTWNVGCANERNPFRFRKKTAGLNE
jgi:hypothetical protein